MCMFNFSYILIVEFLKTLHALYGNMHIATVFCSYNLVFSLLPAKAEGDYSFRFRLSVRPSH
jgi:hypothetical protein